jgi:hypothetical protein
MSEKGLNEDEIYYAENTISNAIVIDTAIL